MQLKRIFDHFTSKNYLFLCVWDIKTFELETKYQKVVFQGGSSRHPPPMSNPPKNILCHIGLKVNNYTTFTILTTALITTFIPALTLSSDFFKAFKLFRLLKKDTNLDLLIFHVISRNILNNIIWSFYYCRHQFDFCKYFLKQSEYEPFCQVSIATSSSSKLPKKFLLASWVWVFSKISKIGLEKFW